MAENPVPGELESLIEEITPDKINVPTPDEALARADKAAELEDDAELIVDPPLHPLGRSLVLTGSGVQGSGHGPLEVTGEANLRIWIEKCMRTHEGAHPIHPGGYGLQRPIHDYLGEEAEFTQLTELEGDVRDALLFHPSITDLIDFNVQVESDPASADAMAQISFGVVRDDGSQLDFGTTLNSGEVL